MMELHCSIYMVMGFLDHWLCCVCFLFQLMYDVCCMYGMEELGGGVGWGGGIV
jgi:hypothetical protein